MCVVLPNKIPSSEGWLAQRERSEPGWIVILPSKVADPPQGLAALTHIPVGAASVIPMPLATWMAVVVVATIDVLLRQSWVDWSRKPTIAAEGAPIVATWTSFQIQKLIEIEQDHRQLS